MNVIVILGIIAVATCLFVLIRRHQIKKEAKIRASKRNPDFPLQLRPNRVPKRSIHNGLDISTEYTLENNRGVISPTKSNNHS